MFTKPEFIFEFIVWIHIYELGSIRIHRYEFNVTLGHLNSLRFDSEFMYQCEFIKFIFKFMYVNSLVHDELGSILV